MDPVSEHKPVKHGCTPSPCIPVPHGSQPGVILALLPHVVTLSEAMIFLALSRHLLAYNVNQSFSFNINGFRLLHEGLLTNNNKTVNFH